jgi:hypothetical protein
MEPARSNWPAVFAEAHPEPGASDEILAAAIADLRRPLTEEEAKGIARSQSNPFPGNDPLHAAWKPFEVGPAVVFEHEEVGPADLLVPRPTA